MFNVGDLVKRIRTLNFGSDPSSYLIIDHTISEDVGIVLEVEEPKIDVEIYNLKYPECFVKVLWQTTNQPSLNPAWHWGEELELYKKNT